MGALAALLASGWKVVLNGGKSQGRQFVRAELRTPKGELMVEVETDCIGSALEGLLDELIFAGAAHSPVESDA